MGGCAGVGGRVQSCSYVGREARRYKVQHDDPVPNAGNSPRKSGAFTAHTNIIHGRRRHDCGNHFTTSVYISLHISNHLIVHLKYTHSLLEIKF